MSQNHYGEFHNKESKETTNHKIFGLGLFCFPYKSNPDFNINIF